jgi:hypothetical protein
MLCSQCNRLIQNDQFTWIQGSVVCLACVKKNKSLAKRSERWFCGCYAAIVVGALLIAIVVGIVSHLK